MSQQVYRDVVFGDVRTARRELFDFKPRALVTTKLLPAVVHDDELARGTAFGQPSIALLVRRNRVRVRGTVVALVARRSRRMNV